MFKKVLASVLIAASCTSAVLYGLPHSVAQAGTEPVIAKAADALSAYDPGNPFPPAGDRIIESVRLGDYIYASLYDNGVVVAEGCGDMYDSFTNSPFANADQIRYVYLTDQPMQVQLSDKPESEMSDAEKTLQQALKDGVINSIGRNVFGGAEKLKGVEFISCTNGQTFRPSRITVISSNAFLNCSALEYIHDRASGTAMSSAELPPALVQIGESAFSGCKAAKFGNLTVPASVDLIGYRAFENCEGITALTVPGSGQTSIGESAFMNCSNLKKAVLGDSIASMGANLFQNSNSLEDLTIPYFGLNPDDTSHTIFTFFSCSGYPQHDANTWLVFTDRSSFYYYIPKTLKKVTVTGGNVIPMNFFCYNVQSGHIYYEPHNTITSVTLPAGITSIGDNAFAYCKDLATLRFGYSSGTTAVLPASLREIGNSAFSGCKALHFGNLTVPASVDFIGTKAFENCEGITALTVPGNGQTSIGESAFMNCSNLKKAVLGDSIASMGANLFQNSNSLENLTIPYFGLNPDDTSSTVFTFFSRFEHPQDNADIWLVFTDRSSFYYYIPKTLKKVTVTGGSVVPASFFSYNVHYSHIYNEPYDSITSVTLPADITSIGDNAFANCKDLSNLRFGSSSGTTVVLPASLREIGNSAFSGCKAAKFGNLTVPASVDFIGTKAFENCEGITALTVPGSGQTSIGESAFMNCSNLKKAVLGDSIVSMGADLFQNSNSLEDLTIPYFGLNPDDTSSTIFTFFSRFEHPQDNADIWLVFTDRSSVYYFVPKTLKKVTVTGGNVIPMNFFCYNVQSGHIYYEPHDTITTVTLPAGLTAVGENAFYGCKDLQKAYLLGGSADWSNVTVHPNGNDPLLNLIGQSGTVVLVQNPSDVTKSVNETAQFTVSASGSDLHYQWQYNNGSGWTNSTAVGAKTASVTVTATAARDGQQYRCIITQGSSSTGCISGAATLKVRPQITAQPADKNADISAEVQFTVAASGKNLTYQWQYNNGSGWKNSTAVGAKTASVTVTATAARDGQQYRCVVTSGSGAKSYSGAVVLKVHPQITAQPADKTADISAEVQFTVAASGKNLTYQWQYNNGSGWKNSTAVGAKTASVTVTATAARDGQQYRCVVTSGSGAKSYSGAATLKVRPQITAQPADKNADISAEVQFTVAASGKNLTYQWQYNNGSGWKNSTAVGAKTASVTVTATAARDGQQYRCVVTSGSGAKSYSGAAVLKVHPQITAQPADVTAANNTSVQFTVAASGKNLTYQWQYNNGSGWKNSTAVGAKTASVTVTATAARDGQQYRCIVTSASGAQTISGAATLKVRPQITAQPADVTAANNTSVQFTVAASGKNLTYQWQYNFGTGWKNSTTAGADTASVAITAKTYRNGYQYRCVITSASGASVTSEAATLTVTA